MKHFRADFVDAIFGEDNAEYLITVFHSFLSGNYKQDEGATIANTNHLLNTLLENKIICKSLSTLWGDTNGCYESYCSSSVLYPLSTVACEYYSIIDRAVDSWPGKSVVGGLNTINKHYLR